jgi:hypothetical protein
MSGTNTESSRARSLADLPVREPTRAGDNLKTQKLVRLDELGWLFQLSF